MKSPALFFAIASTLFGALLAGMAPPLRGPDETAHFLRAYGVAQGDFIPSQADSQGRKGIFLPRQFYAEFKVFDAWQERNRGPNFNYARAFEDYKALPDVDGTLPALVFVPYAGAEGYSPVAYLPHAAAALAARVVGMDFLPTFYLMRIAGLVVMVAVVAYAIAIAPALHWPFIAVAMLPSALYGRAVINADAAALAYSLVAISLFLRVATKTPGASASSRAGWLLLSSLSKPANLALILLEWFSHKRLSSSGWIVLAVSTPSLFAAMLWTYLSGADAGSWRLKELTGTPLEQFSPSWKLSYLSTDPMALLQAFSGWLAKTDPGEFGRQLIGVLGLFDTVLQNWIYNVLALLLGTSFLAPFAVEERWRCVLGAFLTCMAYCATIFLIMYLVWTPIDADLIWGVQGRYFVPALPLLAIIVAGTCNVSPPPWLPVIMATGLTLLSAAGSAEAILRADWNF